ncbi:MAG: S-layer homology domain-containing protein [Oscillospiraceae bacterium]|nr:S-layer homology domain-containing protein [Oscillospiraceae bacterium]
MKKIHRTRRRLSALLAVLLLVTLLPMGSLAATGYTDGVYQGTGVGRNGAITLSVTIENGVIAAIDVVSQSETPRYWNEAVTLLQTIIDANSAEVDCVSGATLSSDGIKAAVNDALAKASSVIPGSGTTADPYVLSTAAHLRAFAAHVDAGEAAWVNAVVVLGADVDLAGEPFDPIGAEGKASANTDKLFGGTFDGRGHTISGLAISGSYQAEANVGLFSTLGASAHVRNVRLANVSVAVSAAEGTSYVNLRAGGVAGDTARAASGAARAAVIDGCTVSGDIRVSTKDGLAFAGGVIGRLFTKAAVINCSFDGGVSASGAASWGTAYAGGLAGLTGSNTVLANAASFGSVTAQNTVSTSVDAYTGGLAGMLSGKVYNVYSASAVTLEQNADVSAQYAGLLAGQVTDAASGNFVYYASDAALTVNGAAAPAAPWAENSGDFAEGADVAMTGASFAAADFADTLNGSIRAVDQALNESSLALREWALTAGKVLPTDTVWTPGEVDAGIFASGSGTQTDPYLIMTKEQMQAFAASVTPKVDYTGVYIRLGADLDLSGEDWSPVGGSYARFNGDFDGAGKTISGLTVGSPDAPRVLDGESAYIGLFGWLNEKAVIHDLTLDGVAIYTESPGSAYVGGIAGRMSGSETEGDYRGVVIDGCAVRGVIRHTTQKGTSFIGGVSGHVFKGAIINTMTDVTVTGKELSGELAEVGGMVGLLNRGVVANCYALGDITGSGYRDTQYDIEGMACVGNIAAVNGGYIANCYGEGGVEALEYSIDTGVLAGWVTGIAKVYDCWYNETARMVIDGHTVTPVDPFGEIVAGGVSDEWGFRFPGSLLDNNSPYKPGAEGAKEVADGLNANFAAFPIDLQGLYGLPADCLRTWTIADDHAVLSDTHTSISYVQPDIEKETETESDDALLDGVWYGRSPDKRTIVAITVQDGAVTDTKVVSGDASGEGYDAALARARFKATYGDTTDYSQADAVHFAGSGTQADPYRITSEKDLRALAASIDEDVDWAGVYFLQTQDISLTGGDWTPIGWGIFADTDGDGFGQDVAALYPFRGNYDGGGHAIRGLRAGGPDHYSGNNWMGLFGIIQGDYTSNEIPAGDVSTATLRNIRLEDVGIYTEGRWRNYVGGLVGNAQGGFVIDNCSVTGTIVSRSTEDFAFAGGLAGSLMYGCVSDCWTDVDAMAWSGKNYSYTAGMAAVTNRATIINSYTLGDVHGDADQTNRAEAGGFVALDGGVCINCYARGNVEIVSKYSMYLGGFVGMAASSSEHRQCYYNTDADQKIAGEPVAEKRYAGKFVNESAEANAQAQTAAVMTSETFADMLNANRAALSDTLAQVRSTLGADVNGSSKYHSLYYNGDGSDLNAWMLADGTVGFTKVCDGGENCPSKIFRDVDQSLWYHEAIDYVVVKGLFNGTSPTTFEPDTAMTRAMLVTVLHRMEGAPAPKTQAAFTDLTQDWYRDAVAWAAENGIVSGMSETTFAPDAKVTREQAMTMLMRCAAFKGLDVTAAADLSAFGDAGSVSMWAEPAVRWAVAARLIQGMPDGTLQPQGGSTRAQVATILMRFQRQLGS